MPVVSEKSKWPVVTQESKMNKGPLVKVQIGKNQFRKMYEADAIALGYIPAKSKPPAPNKMKNPEIIENKSSNISETPEAEISEAPELKDDFTGIPGIGKATARALVAHGVTSFEDLRNAGHLDFVSPRVMEIIEAWRNEH